MLSKERLNDSEAKANVKNAAEIKLDNMEHLTHFRETIKESSTKSPSSIADVDSSVHPDVMEARSMEDGGYRLPHPIWTDNEVGSVQITHRPPETVNMCV